MTAADSRASSGAAAQGRTASVGRAGGFEHRKAGQTALLQASDWTFVTRDRQKPQVNVHRTKRAIERSRATTPPVCMRASIAFTRS